MEERELRVNEYPIKFAIFLLGLKAENIQDFSTKVQEVFSQNEAEVLSESFARKRFATTKDNYKAEITAKVENAETLVKDIKTTFKETADWVSVLTEEVEFEIMTDEEYAEAYLKKK